MLSSTGAVLAPQQAVAAAGVSSGDVLVATTGPLPGAGATSEPVAVEPAGRLDVSWLVAGLAGAFVLLAGLLAATSGEPVTAAVVLLGLTVVVALLPFGRFGTQRALVGPLAAAAAAFALVHEPGAVHLPVTAGVAALVGSVAAAAARALGTGRRQPLDVVLVVGLVWFATAAGVTLAGAPPQVFWSLLMFAALLGCRLVPGLAVDVPDHMLIDLERLAVTAWSARERRPGKRGRVLVNPDAVRALLDDGSALVNAGGVAIALSAVAATPGLLDTATLGVDRVGGVALALLVAGGLALAARNLRHDVARVSLRAGAVGVLALLALDRLGSVVPTALPWVLAGLVAVALLVVLAAVATGRGWRSVRWARRAELAESLCLAFAMGAAVVATSAFRTLWEL